MNFSKIFKCLTVLLFVFIWCETGFAEDTDNNGIEDAWELQYFGKLIGEDSFNDSDNDGYSNFVEYIAGTNPMSPEVPTAQTTINYEYDSVGRIKKIERILQ